MRAWRGRLSRRVESRSNTASAAAPERHLRPRTLIPGRYRIVSLLGQGGMGELYHAIDNELRTEVALKFILSSLSPDPEVVHRFKREIHLARKVTHPNVCRI